MLPAFGLVVPGLCVRILRREQYLIELKDLSKGLVMMNTYENRASKLSVIERIF